MSFKAPTTGLEDKVFNFWKQKHAEDFVKNCESIAKYITVSYNNVGHKTAMDIKKMEKPVIDNP